MLAAFLVACFALVPGMLCEAKMFGCLAICQPLFTVAAASAVFCFALRAQVRLQLSMLMSVLVYIGATVATNVIVLAWLR